MVTRRLNPIPLDDFPMPGRPWTNISPFTYRDGATYLKVLEDLRAYIFRVLVPHINSEMEGIEDWNTEAIEALVESVEAHTAELDQRLTGAMEALESAVDDRIAAHGANIADELAANLVEVHTIVQDYLANVDADLATFRQQVADDTAAALAVHDGVISAAIADATATIDGAVADASAAVSAAADSAEASLNAQVAAQDAAVSAQLAAQDAAVASMVGDLSDDVAGRLADNLVEVNNAIAAAIAQIEDDSFIAALVNLPESETRAAIMTIIGAGGIFSDEAVAALIVDADSATRAALEPLLGDAITDAAINAIVSDESSATRQTINSAAVDALDPALSSLTTAVADNTDAIDGHDTRISANESAIDGHDTRISANESAIAAIPEPPAAVTNATVGGWIDSAGASRDAVDARVQDGLANADLSALNITERPTPVPPSGTLAIPAVTPANGDAVILADTDNGTSSGNLVVRDTAGHVRVPVTPTVNGQAASKQYVDSRIPGLELLTGNLNTAYAGDGIRKYRQPDAAAALASLNYPLDGLTGVLEVELVADQTYLQTYKGWISSGTGGRTKTMHAFTRVGFWDINKLSWASWAELTNA